MAHKIFSNVVVENSAITNGDGESTLLDDTVQCALKALGADRSIDALVVASQTGWQDHPTLDKSIAERLQEVGVTIAGKIHRALVFSNSQPTVAGLASYVEEEQGRRSLFIAMDQPRRWPPEDRAKKIGEQVLAEHQPRFSNMMEALEHITRAFTQHYGLSTEELHAIVRRIALELHKGKAKNPLSQYHESVSAETYDDPQKNRWVSDLLRLYDCCPITDRGAALVLNHKDRVTNQRNMVQFLAHATCDDTRPFAERMLFKNYPLEEPLYLACQELFSNPILLRQGFTRARLLENGILELHNAIGPLVLLSLIEAGFLPYENIVKNFASFDLKRINPSGGLLSGHPLSATFPSLLHFYRLHVQSQATPQTNYALFHSIWGPRDRSSVSLFMVK